jgi:hypothetical protein
MITCYLDMAKEVAMVERNEQVAPFAVTSFSARKRYSAACRRLPLSIAASSKPVSVPPACLNRCVALESARAEQGKQTQAATTATRAT